MKMSKITTDLLVRFFEDKTTSEENNMIADWIESDPANQDIFNRELQLHLMFLKLSAETNVTPAHSGSARSDRRRRKIWVSASIAASFIVGILLSWWVMDGKPLGDEDSRMLAISTDPGQRASITLTDGTIVELNSGSKLEYPASFSRKERRVRIEGEAMFDVAKDAGKPFFVETFAYDVKVLGTKFNVMAEEETGEFCTALIEGHVSIMDKNNETVVNLEADQMVSLVDGSLRKTQSENIGSQYRWTEGIINCGGLTFGQVLMKFEKAFGVDIRVEREAMPENKIRYMKVYVSDGPAAALEILKQVVDFDYSYDYKTNTYLIR